MQNNTKKVFSLQKEFNIKELNSKTNIRLSYKKILIKTIFSMPPEMMLTEMSIIEKREKLDLLITPFGILSEEIELKKLTDMLIKSVQYN